MGLQLNLTDKQRLDKINELGSMIVCNKEDDGTLSQSFKTFACKVLDVIGECNESWCDNCKIKKALNTTCDMLFE